MTKVRFDPNEPLLIFGCMVEYHSRAFLDLALDTGASSTVISEKIAQEIGYDLSRVSKQTTFSDASQTHLVSEVTLKSLSLATARVENIKVLCYTMREEHGIDGVIGLNFIRQFKIVMDFETGILTLDPIQSQPQTHEQKWF